MAYLPQPQLPYVGPAWMSRPAGITSSLLTLLEERHLSNVRKRMHKYQSGFMK